MDLIHWTSPESLLFKLKEGCTTFLFCLELYRFAISENCTPHSDAAHVFELPVQHISQFAFVAVAFMVIPFTGESM